MTTEIKLPELGENLEGGEVLDVKVAAGDTVSEGQALLEVEAEKSTVEVPSPMAGQVTKLLVQKGEQVKVGQPFCVIEGAAADKDGGAKVAPARQAAKSQSEPEPKIAVKETGSDEPAANAGATAEGPATTAPPHAPSRPAGDGQRRETPKPAPSREAARPAPQPAQPAAVEKLTPAGPATRRLAREFGVDLRQVVGSARGGRITQEDIKDYVRQLSAGISVRGPGVQAPPLPDFARWGPIERRPLEPVRRRTAEQMSLAWTLIPHVTQHDQSDITDLDAFRRQQEGKGPKLTVTAFALKAAAIALKQFPQFNASLDAAAGQLVLKGYYHIGVAVDTERGLLVPVVRDVDKKSVQQLAQELTDLAERARQKKVPAEEMRGGTFTITNLGGIGGTAFSPIINYPEVAILGLSRARLLPVVRDGQVVPRLILPLSLSYDHRIIDGADAARFTRRIAEMLENPLVMLLHA
jgi:pyruvate dehydrogenase E2 component (dihydrolipoamide acetyltransferase)